VTDKYRKVRHDAAIFDRKCEYAHHGLRFRCPSCGLVRYLLGKDAKFWNGERLGCKSCGNPKIELRNKVDDKRAVHLNNIKSRKTNITTGTDNLVRR